MGNGDIVVGKKPQNRTPKTVIVDKLAQRAGAPAPVETTPAKAEKYCGAMSQQRGDSGTISTPQKFVRLVGCRERKAPAEPPPRTRPEG